MTATALVVSPDGATMAPVDWSLCRTPKATSNNDVVDPACLDGSGTTAPVTSAAPVALVLPTDGCRLFGPDTPPQAAGQPPTQPRAPDVTGGYYQPILAALAGTPTIALGRIRCALAGASFAVSAEYAAEYSANSNPTLTPLAVFVDGAPVALDAIPAGRAVTLAAGWTAASVESFPVLDPAAQALVTHAESMTVSWLATDGTIRRRQQRRPRRRRALRDHHVDGAGDARSGAPVRRLARQPRRHRLRRRRRHGALTCRS